MPLFLEKHTTPQLQFRLPSENLSDSSHSESCLLKQSSHQPKKDHTFYMFWFFLQKHKNIELTTCTWTCLLKKDGVRSIGWQHRTLLFFFFEAQHSEVRTIMPTLEEKTTKDSSCVFQVSCSFSEPTPPLYFRYYN